ncbi:3-isopropylmalate dehydratase small subunit [Pseudomonas tolaasii]
MRKLNLITGIAVVYDARNVDTDQICPARFLHTPRTAGYADNLFRDFRFDQQGLRTNFIFNQPPFDKSRVVICGDNFGCGSSREQAVWALDDFGIRVLIAPRFGDIFRGNCVKNGILPIIFDQETLDNIKSMLCEVKLVRVDLLEQFLEIGDMRWRFDLDVFTKNQLLSGISEIDETMMDVDEIEAFENTYAKSYPWMQS